MSQSFCCVRSLWNASFRASGDQAGLSSRGPVVTVLRFVPSALIASITSYGVKNAIWLMLFESGGAGGGGGGGGGGGAPDPFTTMLPLTSGYVWIVSAGGTRMGVFAQKSRAVPRL